MNNTRVNQIDFSYKLGGTNAESKILWNMEIFVRDG